MFCYYSIALNCCIIAIVRRQRLEGAYGQAMVALRDARTGSIAVEQRHNFGGKQRSGAAALRQAKRPKLST